MPDSQDDFVLDIHVVTDPGVATASACDTDDGCAPTCASSCTSNA